MSAIVEHLESVIKTLIKDRDELQEKITAMCKAIPNYDWGGDSEKRITDLAKELDALKVAGKLALDALYEAQTADDGMAKWDRNKSAITALNQAGVQ